MIEREAGDSGRCFRGPASTGRVSRGSRRRAYEGDEPVLRDHADPRGRGQPGDVLPAGASHASTRRRTIPTSSSLSGPTERWTARTGRRTRGPDAGLTEQSTRNRRIRGRRSRTGRGQPREQNREAAMPRLTIVIGGKGAGNAERVAARVGAGTGHHVPRAEVERRWKASQDNLVRTAPAIDVVDLLDNTGPKARLITRIRDGQPTSPASRHPNGPRRSPRGSRTPAPPAQNADDDGDPARTKKARSPAQPKMCRACRAREHGDGPAKTGMRRI